MSVAVLEARRVSYRAVRATLVRDVSFDACAGEILALVGPNGAGKSTLLRLLSGELRPLSGEVRVRERSLPAWDRLALAKTRAVLAQSYDLSFAFTAEDVVHLGRSPHHGTSSALRDRMIVDLAMRASGSSALRDRSYPTLSGGEKQLVHAARAFAQLWEGPGPRVLLLDEPTASLDLAHQHALLAAVRRLAADGCAVVCVLHDLNLAAQYADHVAVLARGSLRALGTPEDALTTPLLADVFGVRAAVVPHPELACPLVVSLGPIEPAPTSRSETKEMTDEA